MPIPLLFGSPWSIELVPGQGALDSSIHQLTKGTRVYVASIPGRAVATLVDACTQLRSADLEPVPHIAARGLKSEGEVDVLLGRLRDEADIRSVLLLGGDIPPVAAGLFPSSLALLRTGLLARHRIEQVGFATYPEQHPLIEAGVLQRELVAKLLLAEDQGLASWLVTQFCFDADVIIGHAERLRAAGLTSPLHVGMMGPTSWKGLAKYAKICGVAASARAVTRNRIGLVPLLLGFDPTQIIRPVAETAARRPELKLAQPHFFTFGGFGKTVEWLTARLRDAPCANTGEPARP
jgi:methylenetetrahydrofolate reductase (NADPH)